MRITFRVIGALLFIVTIGVVGRVAFRPAMPEPWRTLHAGMTHQQVLAVAGGQHIRLDELHEKGFDVFSYETTMLGGSCCWQLYVNYDQTGGLMSAGACFIFPSCDLLSRRMRQSIL